MQGSRRSEALACFLHHISQPCVPVLREGCLPGIHIAAVAPGALAVRMETA